MQASSPDELALVNFASFAGYEFAGTDNSQNLVLKIEGRGEMQYKLLDILEFDSDRLFSIVQRLL